MLAFDTRSRDALDLALPITDDVRADPVVRTFAAVAANSIRPNGRPATCSTGPPPPKTAGPGPRADYCIGRVALLRGLVRTANRHFRRSAAAQNPFDRSFQRHLHSMIARASAATGALAEAASALEIGPDAPRIKTYEPEWELATAALLAASLHLDQAAEHAAWVADVAAAHE